MGDDQDEGDEIPMEEEWEVSQMQMHKGHEERRHGLSRQSMPLLLGVASESQLSML